MECNGYNFSLAVQFDSKFSFNLICTFYRIHFVVIKMILHCFDFITNLIDFLIKNWMEVHDNLLLNRNGKENPKEESSH